MFSRLAPSFARAVRVVAPSVSRAFKPQHLIKQSELHLAQIRNMASKAERIAAHEAVIPAVPKYPHTSAAANLKVLRNTMEITAAQIKSGRLPQNKIIDIVPEIKKLSKIYPTNGTLIKIMRHLEKPFARAYRSENEYQLKLFRAFEEAITEQTDYEILWIRTYADSQYTIPKIVRNMYAYKTEQLRNICTQNGIIVDSATQDIEHCREINRAIKIDVNLGAPESNLAGWLRDKLNGPNNLLPIDKDLHPYKTQLLAYIETHPGSNPREAFEKLTPASLHTRLEDYFRDANSKLLLLKVDFEGRLAQYSEEHIQIHTLNIIQDIELYTKIYTHNGGGIKVQFGGVEEEISNKITDFILDSYLKIKLDETDLIDINNDDVFNDIFNKYTEIITNLHKIKENSERVFESNSLSKLNAFAGGIRKNKTLNRKKMIRKTRKLGGGPFNRAGMMVGKQLMTKAAQGALKQSQPLAQTAFKMAPMAFGTQMGNPALKQIPASFGKFVGQSAFPTAINAKKAGFDWHQPSNDETLNSEEFKTVYDELYGEQWHKNNPEESTKILRNLYGQEEWNDLIAKKLKERKMKNLKNKLDTNASDDKKLSEFMKGYAWNKFTNVEKNEKLLAEEVLKGLKKIPAPSKKAIELAGMVYGGSLKYKKRNINNRTKKVKKRRN